LLHRRSRQERRAEIRRRARRRRRGDIAGGRAAVIEVGEGDVAAPSSPRPIANMAMPTDTAASANPMTMYQPARRWESMQTSMNVADALWSPEHKYRRHRRVVAER
jgi:hypothetical protein